MSVTMEPASLVGSLFLYFFPWLALRWVNN